MLTSLALMAALVAGQPEPIDCKLTLGLRRTFVPNRAIVKPRGLPPLPVVRALLAEIFKTSDFSLQKVGSTGAYVVDSASVDLSRLPIFGVPFADDRVEYVERDPYIFAHGSKSPNDPHFSDPEANLWGLIDIAAPAAWLHSTGSETVVAAIVDGGVDAMHPDLKKLWAASQPVGSCMAGSEGYDAIDDQCTVKVRGDHATRMAGAVGARGNNSVGVVGVNWNVGLMSSAFMDHGKGCASVAAKALKFVRLAKSAGHDVRVVNMSWGTSEDSSLIKEELDLLAAAGVVLVASAGNAIVGSPPVDIDSAPVYPACYRIDTLLSVAYTTPEGAIGGSSNFGPKTVDIAAPGEDIWTTSSETDFGYASDFGTSIAAAHVTGAIALLAARCPKLSGKELRELLLRHAEHRPALAGYVKNERFLDIGTAMTYCVCAASK